MKLWLARRTPAGILVIEEDLAGPHQAIDVVRRVESALATAAADIAARHAPATPAGPDDHAPVIATVPAGPPRTGKELWAWAKAADQAALLVNRDPGTRRRVLEVGRALGLRGRTGSDLHSWSADDVQHVFHEIQSEPAKATAPRGATGGSRP